MLVGYLPFVKEYLRKAVERLSVAAAATTATGMLKMWLIVSSM